MILLISLTIFGLAAIGVGISLIIYDWHLLSVLIGSSVIAGGVYLLRQQWRLFGEWKEINKLLRKIDE